jgi:tetratricopeptide (TPR) repeat protein
LRGRLSSVASAFALLAAACVRVPIVERGYDGHVVDGRFIEPEAYAAFLRGASAEASGDVKGALAAYAEAARFDSSGAEIWTRIGDVRCRADPRDAQADASFARALQLDADDAHAWAGKATCALARGDLVGAHAAAQRAAELDATADGANVLLAHTAVPAQSQAARAALVALTVTARDPTLAWEALATWAEAHGDVALWARALGELARIAPEKRQDVARAAEQLAGAGEAWQARAVAAAVVEADVRPLAGDHALLARLAIDEAIARGDAGAASRRATRVRLPLDEVAGRALLGGNRSLARELATRVVRADPTATGALMVLAASGGADLLGVATDIRADGQVVSAAGLVAFGSALVHVASPDQLRAALARPMHSPIIAGDDRVVRPAVELASRGAIAVDALPPDGVVELAALRGAGLAEELLAPDAHGLDARHQYLGLALVHPESDRARRLSLRFASTGTADPIVAAASALMQLATGGVTAAAAAARALLARNAGDPLLAATALRVAERAGDGEIAGRARAALAALGGGSGASVE